HPECCMDAGERRGKEQRENMVLMAAPGCCSQGPGCIPTRFHGNEVRGGHSLLAVVCNHRISWCVFVGPPPPLLTLATQFRAAERDPRGPRVTTVSTPEVRGGCRVLVDVFLERTYTNIEFLNPVDHSPLPACCNSSSLSQWRIQDHVWIKDSPLLPPRYLFSLVSLYFVCAELPQVKERTHLHDASSVLLH
ncbi:hypothetical protein KUCAC02_020953, partial [Chaenocephalus aceratus]